MAVPPALATSVVGYNGDDGRRWLAGLPGTVAGLARRWSLTIGEPFPPGTCALVVRAQRGEARLVLKVPFVDDETRSEPDALRLWDGDGAVRLLDDDPATGALLLEHLAPGTPLADEPDRDAAVVVACDLARRLRRVAPAGHRFPAAAELGRLWAVELPDRWVAAGRPVAADVVDRAVAAAGRVAVVAASEAVVVVNRDLHLGNVLAAEREPWLVIDPKPLVGEPAFDAGHLVGDAVADDPTPRRVARLVALVADGLEADEGRVRDWALVRALEVALDPGAVGEPADGRRRLAEVLAGQAG